MLTEPSAADKFVNEGESLNIPLEATDADGGDTLTFSASGLPGFCSLTDNTDRTGDLDCSPGFDDAGTYPITVTVSDGNTLDDDSVTFNLVVVDVNQAPVLAAIGNQSVAEGDTLNVPLSASDGDGDALTFSGSNLPSFCSLTDTTGPTGNLRCTPGFDDAGSYPNVTVTVSDGNVADDDSETFTISVGNVNQDPVLAPIGNKAVNEGTLLSFTATATDADEPADTLTFSLAAGAPAGASITGGGAFTWTPTEAQGPGSYPITVQVTDGVPNSAVDDFETITVTVNEVNVAPVLDAIGAKSVQQLSLLAFTATASDADDPANALTFSLDAGAPAGANIDATTGLFTWTPTNTQGPGDFSITVRVTDDGAPNLSDTETITVSVSEEPNVAPVLGSIGNRTVGEESTLTFTATATDGNVPAQTLTYSLDAGAPAGAAINPSSGVFSWTPTEAQGPGSYPITVRVTDDGTPSLSDAETITVTVNEANVAPVLGSIGDQVIDEEVTLSFTATATDADNPPNNLTFSLDAGAPAGASIDATTGLFTWTPTEAQGPGSYPITVRVTDDGTPALDDAETISITVDEVNQAPVAVDDSFDVSEGGSTVAGLSVLTNDTDPDETVPNLTAELLSGPALDPAFVLNADGTFSYTHDGSETASDSFTYRACDDGTPSLCSPSATATINVDNVNDPPVVEGQLPLSVEEDQPLAITLADLTVTDVDSDPSLFVLAVQDGTNYTRIGNTITPALNFNGELAVPVVVNDGTDDSEVFNLVVTVTPVNDAPVITGQAGPLSTPEDTSVAIGIADLLVSDPDNIFPSDFTLALQPGANFTLAGNTITPDPDFNGVLSVPAIVNDGLLDSTPFNLTVTVTAENDEPVVLVPIPPQIAIEGSPFTLDVSGNFIDIDGDVLEYSASGLPASGSLVFNTATGVFSGTPGFDDARDNDPYIVVVTATDNQPGTIPAQTQFDLNISALDRANISLELSVAPDPALLNDELQWAFTASNSVGPQLVGNVELTGSIVGTGLMVSSADSCTIEASVGQVRRFDCSLGTLPVGGSSTVLISTTTSVPGDVVVFASAASADPLPLDPNEDDNAGQLAVGVAEAFSNGAVQDLGEAEVRSLAAGDVNGDGAADLIVGTAAGQPIQIFLSGGFRDFVAAPISVPDTAANEGIALADFDGNGTLDLVVANGDGRDDAVYSNDGAANFTLMALLGATFAQDVEVGDFNGDGAADVVIAARDGNPVYLGDGIGGFVAEAPLGSAISRGVAVADFNGDSLDDVAVANAGNSGRVWLRNAGGGFSAANLPPVGDAMAVAVGDFGGGPSADLAFARIAAAADDVAANPVFINDGAGNFAPSAALGSSSTADILAGDVNRDGLTDLVFVNFSGSHQIWTGTGTGFGLYAEQIADTGSTSGILAELGFADVGEPGGVDLALGGAPLAGLGVFLNDGFGNLGRGDAVPPVLTLVGEASVEVPANSTYSDAGATAEDNIDGDISASIVATSNVNTTIVGNYTVTYNVSDFAGNSATPITRTVTVVPAAGAGGGGGGGGGALSGLMLLMLLLAVAAGQSTYFTNRVLVSLKAQKQDQ